MKIAFIGIGNVGFALANNLQNAGYEVLVASNDPNNATVQKAVQQNSNLKVMPTSDAVRASEIVFLATPFAANEGIVTSLASELKGKILVDCTNPVGAGLTHGLGSTQSGSEFVQKLIPETHVVKSFSIYGFENFVNNSYPGYNIKPVMMYCGNDPGAKKSVESLITKLNWEALDVGTLQQALHLEHMTLLWVRMVRMKGQSPNLVWAALRR